MSWLGKILGGVAGFSFGGPIGALIGAAMGHQFFDKAAATADANRGRLGNMGEEDVHIDPQLAFFITTFFMMGYIAKADGRVTREEIDLARNIMDQWDLDHERREFARFSFRKGRDFNDSPDEMLDQLRQECRGPRILRAFVDIQVETAMIDGTLHPREREVLEYICRRLRLPAGTLDAMLRERQSDPDGLSTAEAYALLELSEGCSDADIKRAYRRMMNRHHPDKLASKGLPEEMMRVATEKARKIKAAYEHLRKVRNTK